MEHIVEGNRTTAQRPPASFVGDLLQREWDNSSSAHHPLLSPCKATHAPFHKIQIEGLVAGVIRHLKK